MNIKIYQLLISLNMSMHSWIKLNEIYVDTTYTFMHQDTRDIHVSSRNFFTMIWMNSIDFVTCFIIKLYVSCRFIDQYCSDIQVFFELVPNSMYIVCTGCSRSRGVTEMCWVPCLSSSPDSSGKSTDTGHCCYAIIGYQYSCKSM